MEETSEMFEVVSSNIVSFEYLSDNTLRVLFKHGGTYEYDDVPREVLDEVLGAESVGAAFSQLIKNNYIFRKVDDA